MDGGEGDGNEMSVVLGRVEGKSWRVENPEIEESQIRVLECTV